MIWSGWKIKEKNHVLVNQFYGNFLSKTPSGRKIRCVFRDVKWCFNASWGLKGLRVNTWAFFILGTFVIWFGSQYMVNLLYHVRKFKITLLLPGYLTATCGNYIHHFIYLPEKLAKLIFLAWCDGLDFSRRWYIINNVFCGSILKCSLPLNNIIEEPNSLY